MSSLTPAFDWMIRNQSNLRKVRPEAFFGPDCQFIRAVDELTNDPSARAQFGKGGMITADQFCELPDDPRMVQLARLRLADQFDASALNDQTVHSADAVFQDLKLSPRNDEKAWYAKSLEWLKANSLSLGPGWTVARWRTLSFINDWQNKTGQLLNDTATERTPLFLAGERSGRVLWLVVDRMPGPPIITPHWWRLGLVPLGDKEPLLHAIHRGIQVVLTANSSRFHVRWWLEEYPGGNGWHDVIDEAESAQTAAACVTMALCEPKQEHPVLDGKAGISAKLPDGLIDRQLASIELESVSREAMKTQTAERAGVQCIMFSSDSAKRGKIAVSDPQGLSVLPAKTLGEAYEMLRLTSSDMQQAKQKSVDDWHHSYQETKTEELYIQLSRKDKDE